MFGIKCGDDVIVLSGKDKGKVGSVTKIFKKEEQDSLRLFVSGVGLVKRHYKNNEKKNVSGGIFELESSISISKVAVYNKELKKQDKIICVYVEGKRYRAYKSSKKVF